MKRILIVEDYGSTHRGWCRELIGYDLSITVAEDLNLANSIVDTHPPFDLYVVDGCIPGNTYNTGELTEKIRQKTDAPIIAAASSTDVREIMMKRGCDHECDKMQVADVVVRLLNLSLSD